MSRLLERSSSTSSGSGPSRSSPLASRSSSYQDEIVSRIARILKSRKPRSRSSCSARTALKALKTPLPRARAAESSRRAEGWRTEARNSSMSLKPSREDQVGARVALGLGPRPDFAALEVDEGRVLLILHREDDLLHRLLAQLEHPVTSVRHFPGDGPFGQRENCLSGVGARGPAGYTRSRRPHAPLRRARRRGDPGPRVPRPRQRLRQTRRLPRRGRADRAVAGVSYGAGTKSFREDAALIDHLLRMEHSSPFEQVILAFHVKLPIFVARQWIRHRTARVNEVSGAIR